VFRYVAGQRFGKHMDDSVELGSGRTTAYTLLVYLSGGEAAAGRARLAGGETVFYGALAASRLRVLGWPFIHVPFSSLRGHTVWQLALICMLPKQQSMS